MDNKSIQNVFPENSNVKYITKTNYYTDENGTVEISEVDIFKRCYNHKHFWKVWLTDFLVALDLINNSKQMDVVFHVLENTNSSDNTYIGTYRKIANDSEVSYQTVAIIMKKMAKANIISRVQNGVYKVNPQLIMKGDDNKQHRLVIQYENSEKNNKKNFQQNLKKKIRTIIQKKILFFGGDSPIFVILYKKTT